MCKLSLILYIPALYIDIDTYFFAFFHTGIKVSSA